MSTRSSSRNSSTRCLAWIGQSSGRSLPRCQADTVSHCSAKAATPPCSDRSFLTWHPNAASVSCACSVSRTWPKMPIRVSSMPRCWSCRASSRSLAAACVRRMRRSIISISSSRQRMRAWRRRASNSVCRLPGLCNVQHVTHLQRRGLGGELAQLGMGDAFQQRIGIDQSAQPLQPFHPEPDRLGRRGAWRLLKAVERGRQAVGRLDQQRVQRRCGVVCKACRHPAEDPPMNFSTKPAHQPVQGAESPADRWPRSRNASIARLIRSAGSLMVSAASRTMPLSRRSAISP